MIPKPPQKTNGGPPPLAQPARAIKFVKPTAHGKRVILYGPGGIGKTTLASQLPGATAFFDLDDSLGTLDAENLIVSGVETWQDMRQALLAPTGWNDFRNIVIDSVTKAEELAVAATLLTVPHEKGHKVQRVEDYGYGKGYQHVYDTFLTLLGDLDAHVRAGRNVILIAHDCVCNTPNPQGEDWQRYEPRLQSPTSGKSAIRLRAREWADHVLFLGYDVAVKDGKGRGVGTRTLWPVERPHCMAKNRAGLFEPIPLPFDSGADFWKTIFNRGEK